MPEETKPKRPGTIVRVSYGATVSLPDYENVRFDITAEVGPDERWQDVMARLRALTAQHKATIKADGC